MLNEVQINVANALVSRDRIKSQTVKAIADQFGVSDRTIYIWKSENKEFIALMDKLANEIVEHTRRKLKVASEQAFDDLLDISKDGSSQDRVKLDALLAIIDRAGLKPKNEVTITPLNNNKPLDLDELAELEEGLDDD